MDFELEPMGAPELRQGVEATLNRHTLPTTGAVRVLMLGLVPRPRRTQTCILTKVNHSVPPSVGNPIRVIDIGGDRTAGRRWHTQLRVDPGEAPGPRVR
jgi:hypothetical protein